MKYPKINSLWKREGTDMKGRLIPGQYAAEEVGNIKKWSVQEKIDGTNIRVIYDPCRPIDVIEFKGRSDEAQMPDHLLKYLKETFTVEKMREIFPDIGEDVVRLFGEGYGPKIQTGGTYRADVSFCLFDIFVNGWWLEQPVVKVLAEKLGVPYAPMIGVMTEEEIVAYVKSKPLSLCSLYPQMMEGVICRPEKLLLRRNREPLMFKLKCKEF